jgi:hypothetical protein
MAWFFSSFSVCFLVSALLLLRPLVAHLHNAHALPSAEKAAGQLALERELHSMRMEAQQVKRRSAADRAVAAADEAVVPMDTIGGAYDRCMGGRRAGHWERGRGACMRA